VLNSTLTSPLATIGRQRFIFAKLFTGFLLATLVPGNIALAAEQISGPPHVVDSTTMIVAGKTVKLANIKSLKPGTPCTWKNRPLDCGILAAAGLKDLVAGANVICRQRTADQFTCTAAGYDLAYGLIHAGWAIPLNSAPPRYFIKRDRAKKRQLGFWAAKNQTGMLIAETLSR